MLDDQIRLLSADVKNLSLSIRNAYESAERLLKESPGEQCLRDFTQAFAKDGSVESLQMQEMQLMPSFL